MLATYRGMTVKDLDDLEVYRFMGLLPIDELRKRSKEGGIVSFGSVAEAIAYEEALGLS